MHVDEKWSIVRTLPIDPSIFLLRNEPIFLARRNSERVLCRVPDLGVGDVADEAAVWRCRIPSRAW